VLSIVNGLNLSAIHEDLSFRQRKAISRKVRAGDEEEHRLFERDPFIYFYEDYLKAYDKDTRKARGVYYTPPPIVNFIVRAVDDILKNSFGIREGLADNRVNVLDFACGTGRFYVEAVEILKEKYSLPLQQIICYNLFAVDVDETALAVLRLKVISFFPELNTKIIDALSSNIINRNALVPKAMLLPENSMELTFPMTSKKLLAREDSMLCFLIPLTVY
jgi:predicted helicase